MAIKLTISGWTPGNFRQRCEKRIRHATRTGANMNNNWTKILTDISEVARQSLHNLVSDNTPPLPQCYEREFMQVATRLKKDTVLQEVMTDQAECRARLKAIMTSAGDSLDGAEKILKDFETDALKSLALLEKEFEAINDFIKAIDEKQGEKLGRNINSFLDAGNEYTRKIGNAMLDIRQHRKKLGLLAEEIDLDNLSGTYNAQTWHHDIQEITEAANRDADSNKGFCLAVIDIDNFRQINDTYGHPIGDAILRQLGLLTKNHFTASGSVYRYGGDEFAVIMPGIQIDEALRHVESFQSQLAKTVMIADGGKTRIKVTTSCGISCWKPAMTAEEVVDRAEMALSAAKKSGRNCVRIFSE